ncbi:MAG: glycosyltransferase 87 family protein [Chloroflexota bacterium]
MLHQNETSPGLPSAADGTAGRASKELVLPLPVRLGLWAAAFVLALILALQWGGGTGVHNDFTQNVWLPARLVLNGDDPYNPTRAAVDAALGSYAVEFTGFNSGTNFHAIYPTWVYLLLSPFAAIPLAFSLAIWRSLNLLLLFWAVMRMLRVSNPAFRSSRPAAIVAVGVTLLLAFIYRESIVTLFAGQFSIIEFGLLAGIWGYLISSHSDHTRRRLVGDILMGAALAVLATKPQAVGLPVLLLGLWALTRRRWAIPLSAVASLALLLLAPLLFFPSSLSGWLGVVISGQASSQAEVSASVWGLSYQWLPGSIPWVPVAISLSLVGLLALVPSWRRDLTDRKYPVPLALPLTICINSIISPYMLGYEHVLLLVPAMIFLAAAGLPDEQKDARSMRWRVTIYGWMAVLPFLIVAVQSFVDREYPVIVQSLTMLALCLLAKCGLRIVADAPSSRFVLGAQSAVSTTGPMNHESRSAQTRGETVDVNA